MKPFDQMKLHQTLKRAGLLAGLYILISISMYASKRPVVYVAAMSGVSLREAPNKRATKIETLAYGTRISNYNYAQEWDSIDGYWASWLRVAINGKDGYIYGGYVIPLMPPKPATKDLATYLKEAIGERKSADTLETGDGSNLVCHKYRSAIMYQESWYEFGSECALINLNMTVQEAYLLFVLLERNVNGIWGSYIEGKTALLPENYPKQGYKKENLEVYRRTWDGFEMMVDYIKLRIYQIQQNVVVCWTLEA